MRLLVLLFCLTSSGFVAEAQEPSPAPSAPLFRERPFGPRPMPTPTPRDRPVASEERKPIPIGWTIAGWSLAALAVAAILYGSVRAWRSSNLFGRQYRFPTPNEVSLRFGGTKSGGHMATVEFGPQDIPR